VFNLYFPEIGTPLSDLATDRLLGVTATSFSVGT